MFGLIFSYSMKILVTLGDRTQKNNGTQSFYKHLCYMFTFELFISWLQLAVSKHFYQYYLLLIYRMGNHDYYHFGNILNINLLPMSL